MASFSIEWKRSALRELKSLDRQAIPKIVNAIEGLQENPRPEGVKKLVGSEHTYRIRVGDYRVIYNLMAAALVIEVIRVRHRKEAYGQ